MARSSVRGRGWLIDALLLGLLAVTVTLPRLADPPRSVPIAAREVGPVGVAGAPAAFAPAATSPAGTTCPVFPADNIWNTDISALPVQGHSSAWLASMNAGSTRLHPDFGPSFGAQPIPYGMPYEVVDASHAKVPVTFDYADESDPGPYPFGSETPIEGGQNAAGDRHALMVDSSSCTLYELYNAHYAPGASTAGSGAIWNLRSDALRPAGWTSADAAGLPIFPGLLRPEEVAAGQVTHAIRFTAARTDTSYLWPARHQAGSRSDPSLPPMGARFRLKAGFDITAFRPDTQVVLRAMQHYGLILADNGSNWYFQGTADNWDNTFLDELKSIPASAFEAVDESSLMVSPDSGQARGGAPGGAACTAGPVTPGPTGPVARLAGADRDATAAVVAGAVYGTTNPARSAVVASDGSFADALAGTPLAVARHGPLLLTGPDSLSASARAVLASLPAGSTVYVLGGTGALSTAIDDGVRALGLVAVRLAGIDRFATAVAIAGALGDPPTVLEASGTDFADALSAGAAAGHAGGAVLLTAGTAPAAATTAYLAAHPADQRTAVGGPAAAADPTATAVVGADRYATSAAVEARYFTAPSTVGFAAGTAYPDALSGGAAVGADGGPLLLVPPCGALPGPVSAAVAGVKASVATSWLFGGSLAVGDDVLAELDKALGP